MRYLGPYDQQCITNDQSTSPIDTRSLGIDGLMHFMFKMLLTITPDPNPDPNPVFVALCDLLRRILR